MRVKEESVSRPKGIGDMHRRVYSTEVEGDVKPKVLFADEKEKETVKPKKNVVTQFIPKSKAVLLRGLPAP